MMQNIPIARFRLVLLGAVLVVAACALSPNTYTNVDSSADFTQYKTFGFFEPLATDKADYESLESKFLKSAVTKELNRRGLTYSDKPDLKFNFYINTEEKIRSHQTPAISGFYGYRGAYYGVWGGYETHIDQYTEGTLNIDAVDMQRKKLVWESAIVGRITREVRNNLESAINDAVNELFRKFPVKPEKTNTDQ